MAHPKSTVKATRPTYDEPCIEQCVQSPLGNIYDNSSIQNNRLSEMNHLLDELIGHLGLGRPSEGSEKLAAAAPYGRLEEIIESQNYVFRIINELENKIFDLRNALM